ncbi:hypothetical protein BSZ21_05330 [Bradyrhizobium canariense]|uniref:hypothetical protein n=1 Tax=Bradyrhizobium canariense TaxID=255045 RepID=UPI000A18D5AD|nr:hypothetical protein [Bradyrhizobium canariense]OSI74979.1 hypothetical protein BSZ21_05330 [Bradyrhizobium canariense]
MNHQSYKERLRIIEAYDEMLKSRLSTSKGYFVNFMFNRLPGNRKAKLQQMQREIERFHSLLTRHIVRKPNSKGWRHLRPVLVLAPDLPVPKREKTSGKRTGANGGLHINGALLVPPRRRQPKTPKAKAKRKQSRLRTSVKKHLRENEPIFVNQNLARIDLTRIEHGTMADYMFKTVKNGLAEWDDVMIFN